jgi:hypothetical protein
MIKQGKNDIIGEPVKKIPDKPTKGLLRTLVPLKIERKI